MASFAIVQAQPDLRGGGKAANPQVNQFVFAERNKPTNIRLLAPDGEVLANKTFGLNLTSGNSSFGFGSVTTDAAGIIQLNELNNHWQQGRFKGYVFVAGVGSAFLDETDINWKGLAPQKDLRLNAGGTLNAVVRGSDPNNTLRLLGGANVALNFLPPQSAQIGNLAGAGIQRRNDMRAVDLTTRDGDGSLTITNLAPGRYRVTVKSLADFLPVEQELEIKENQTTAIEVSLEKNSMTHCRVKVEDEAGQPLINQEVMLHFQSPPEEIEKRMGSDFHFGVRHILTDARGEATIFPLRPGSWLISSFDKFRIPQTKVTLAKEGGEVTLIAKRANQ